MSYADGNTPYVCSENVDVTLEKLEEVGKVLFEWFSNNFLETNADQCHLILSTHKPFSINRDNEVIFFFYQGFLSRTLTTHRTAGEGRGPSFSTISLPPAHEHSDIYLQLCT